MMIKETQGAYRSLAVLTFDVAEQIVEIHIRNRFSTLSDNKQINNKPCIYHRKTLAEKYIMTAAKLIAPAIEASFAAGFDW